MRMKRWAALLAAALAMPCLVASARAQSRNWTITLRSGEKLEEITAISVHEDTLVADRDGLARALPLDSVATLYRYEGSRAVGGTLIGGGIGLLGGLYLGVDIATHTRGDGPSPAFFIAPVVGAVLGGIVGGNVGASSKIETNYNLAAMTPEERQRALWAYIVQVRSDSIVEASYARNNIYAEMLGAGVFYSINYETMLSQQTALRVGLEYVSQGVVIPVTVSYLFFKGPAHLELAGGVVQIISSERTQAPVISIGYRYQPVKSGLLFAIRFHSFLEAGYGGNLFEKGGPIGFSFGYSF